MTDCPACGYHDPFHTSWFDHEKEVAEPLYFKEWAPDIWESLQQASWILSEDGRILWHLTKGGTVERWKVDVVMVLLTCVTCLIVVFSSLRGCEFSLVIS